MDDVDWRWWGRVHRLGHIKVGWILFVGGRQELGHVVVVDDSRWSCSAVADIWMMMMDRCW